MSAISVQNLESTKNTPSVNTQETKNVWKPQEITELGVDVYREGMTIYVISTVAGVDPKDIDISVEGNILFIKGSRKKPYSEKEGATVLLEECFWGDFYRELTIYENLDIDGIKASLNQGILIVEVPILQNNSQKKIKVLEEE